MKRKFSSLLFAVTALLLSGTASAQDMHIPEKNMPAPVPAGVPEVVELNGKAMAEIGAKLLEKYGVPPVIYMAYDPLSKLIMVNTDNGPTVYTNRNVDFILGKNRSGNLGLYSHFKGVVEDRSEALLRPFVIDQMATLNDPVVYKSQNEKYRVAVFVEPTCGYCYKLHSEMDSYLAEGITLEYYPFPIYGEFSDLTMARLWSLPASERPEAVTSVMDYVNTHRNELRGKTPEEILSRLDLPEATSGAELLVQKTKGVGHNLGIAGTPALVLENGKVLGGYLPAKSLKKILEESK